jgi:hypothetical protein
MKISLRSLGLNTQVAWSGLVQEHLNCLQKPGPDYHADAADYTLAAALHKAVENLKRQILARNTNRRVKGKSNLQLGTISRRWANAFAGHRA